MAEPQPQEPSAMRGMVESYSSGARRTLEAMVKQIRASYDKRRATLFGKVLSPNQIEYVNQILTPGYFDKPTSGDTPAPYSDTQAIDEIMRVLNPSRRNAEQNLRGMFRELD